MNVSLYVILVGYNHKLNFSWDIPENVNFIFVDNSTNDDIKKQNEEYCTLNSISYIDMEGNKGIPAAYNKGILNVNFVPENFIMFLDQDTTLPDDFFQKIIKMVSEMDFDFFFPIVKDSYGIMSPCKVKGKGFVHSEYCDYNLNIKSFSFINSGMCIRSTVFNKIQYEHSLFLDFADHDFIKTAKLLDCFKFFVNKEIVLKQQFSGAQKNSLESDFTRYCIFVRDGMVYYRKWYKKAHLKDFLNRTIKLSVQHKSLKFLRFLIKELKK